MALPTQDLEVAVRKLTNLRRYMPTVPPSVNPNPEEVYGLGYHVARKLAERKPTEPLQPKEYYGAALTYQRGSHMTTTKVEMLAVARVVFPAGFVDEIEAYIDELDRARRPPH